MIQLHFIYYNFWMFHNFYDDEIIILTVSALSVQFTLVKFTIQFEIYVQDFKVENSKFIKTDIKKGNFQILIFLIW